MRLRKLPRCELHYQQDKNRRTKQKRTRTLVEIQEEVIQKQKRKELIKNENRTRNSK